MAAHPDEQGHEEHENVRLKESHEDFQKADRNGQRHGRRGNADLQKPAARDHGDERREDGQNEVPREHVREKTNHQHEVLDHQTENFNDEKHRFQDEAQAERQEQYRTGSDR